MTDIAIFWDFDRASGDLAMATGDLAGEQGLDTAIIISLFTDRRARPDDVLPQEGGDPRGWWGDMTGAAEGDQIGSRLWLLSREKNLPTVVARAQEYAQEALDWLVRDGVAASVRVEAEAMDRDTLGFRIEVVRPDGPDRLRFDYVWKRPLQ